MAAELDAPAIAAAFSQPDNDGSFSGELETYLKGLGKSCPAVLFAFAPKAAGTFLRTAAVRAINGQLVRTVYAQGGRDAQPYLPIFIRYYLGLLGERPLVTHVHMQALPANRRFIETLDLKPIVMIRPIKDMLASYWDMLESDDQALLDGLNCRFPPDFRGLSRERKADFLVDMLGPWYASYFATWLQYADDDPDRVCVLNYDELQSSPERVLEKALAHAGLTRPPEVCAAAVHLVWQEREKHRFHRGETGRGSDYFSPRHIACIDRMLSYYSALDRFADRLAGQTDAV